jgi:hypothetical protein
LEESFDSPQFGQSIITPDDDDAAAEDEAAAAARSIGVEGAAALDGVAAGGTGAEAPPIGAPHVSHHSGSPLW